MKSPENPPLSRLSFLFHVVFLDCFSVQSSRYCLVFGNSFDLFRLPARSVLLPMAEVSTGDPHPTTRSACLGFRLFILS